MPEYNVHGFVADKFTPTREAFEANLAAVPTWEHPAAPRSMARL